MATNERFRFGDWAVHPGAEHEHTAHVQLHGRATLIEALMDADRTEPLYPLRPWYMLRTKKGNNAK